MSTNAHAPVATSAPAHGGGIMTNSQNAARRGTATRQRLHSFSGKHIFRALLGVIVIVSLLWMGSSLRQYTTPWIGGAGVKTLSQGKWTGDAVVNTMPVTNCPVRICIFVNSTEWSKEIPVGEGIDWTRNIVKGTILAIRVDRNDNTTKLWGNDGTSPRFKSGSFIQVRLVEGTGAMTYFDTPSRITALRNRK